MMSVINVNHYVVYGRTDANVLLKIFFCKFSVPHIHRYFFNQRQLLPIQSLPFPKIINIALLHSFPAYNLLERKGRSPCARTLIFIQFFRTVVIKQGLIPCNDQLHLGQVVFEEERIDLVCILTVDARPPHLVLFLPLVLVLRRSPPPFP